MKKVIDFIIEQRMELHDYPTLMPLIKEKFKITDHDGNEATEELITTVVVWEKNTEIYDSLENFLNDRFVAILN
jgi:hypothetical protein